MTRPPRHPPQRPCVALDRRCVGRGCSGRHGAAVTPATAIRPQPIVAETFEVSALFEDGRTARMNVTPTTAEEAVEAGAMRSQHKDKFVVRRFDTRNGNVTLEIWQVRQASKPTRVYRDYAQHSVRQQYAERIATVRL